MFEVLINSDSVFNGNDAFAAWRAYSDMVQTMIPGDEVTLWIGEKLESIETRFYSIFSEEETEEFSPDTVASLLA